MSNQLADVAQAQRPASTACAPPKRPSLRAVSDILDAGQRFLLTCHVRPDGDAVGSMLGLGLALEEAGRDVTLFTTDPPPPVLSFLPGFEKIVHEVPNPLAPETVLCVLDCHEPDRIGPDGPRLIEQASMRVVLDHHVTQVAQAASHHTVSYVNPDLFATGAIVLWILEDLGWPVSKAVATNLYAAILTDTGCFRHNNTTELAFAMAQALVAKGADPSAVARMLYEHYPIRHLRLLALALRTLEVRAGGKVALMHATPEMFRMCAADQMDAEDFVAHPRSIDTVELAVFIREIHAGHVAVSLRSKTHFNVAALAGEFGGGGHFHAAGFRRAGTAAETREVLLQHLAAHFEDLWDEADG